MAPENNRRTTYVFLPSADEAKSILLEAYLRSNTLNPSFLSSDMIAAAVDRISNQITESVAEKILELSRRGDNSLRIDLLYDAAIFRDKDSISMVSRPSSSEVAYEIGNIVFIDDALYKISFDDSFSFTEKIAEKTTKTLKAAGYDVASIISDKTYGTIDSNDRFSYLISISWGEDVAPYRGVIAFPEHIEALSLGVSPDDLFRGQVKVVRRCRSRAAKKR